MFDTDLQARVEDAGINASAPREQLWVDGWLVRRCPGKAKRARCIQAVAAGRMSIDDKLERCRALYADAALRLYVRITPFSQPIGLDAHLESLGMERIDDTRVMIMGLPVAPSSPLGTGSSPVLRFESADAEAFAQWVGVERGSTPIERQAHASRVRQSPVRYRAVLAKNTEERIVAGGQVAVEQEVAGLYDVFTSPQDRQRGHSQALCRYLLDLATSEGARWAYLQVEANNASARHVYWRLGFADAYAYHYRSPSVTEARPDLGS
jgi:GNAT superfamily N-acetyltransferase